MCLNSLAFGIILFLLSCNSDSSENTDILDTKTTNTTYDIQIDVSENQGEVSKLLMGFNTIYCFEQDALWQNGNGKMPDMFRKFNTGILRYPGGAVTNRYHWNNLNGEGWKDNWSPSYNTADDQPESEFMNLDEYMINVLAIGAEPMLGINMGSGMKYNRVQEGISEAVALVQYCKDMNYEVKYFYLDNEAYHSGANYQMTAQEYADQINLYVPAMKAVNSNIEIVINWQRNITSKTGPLETIIKTAGDNIDIVEVHYYWSWENSTFDNWINSFPMDTKSQWYTTGQSYVEEIKAFQPLMNSLGYGNIKLASNEWNLAPAPSISQTPSKFESALMISELFSQYIDANLFMANFWGVHWPNAKGESKNRYILDTENNFSENTLATIFTMFGEAMGGTKVLCDSSIKGVYDIAVINESKNELIIYIVNKKQAYETLSTGIDLQNFSFDTVEAQSYVKDTDEKGELITTPVHIENGNRLILNLPKYSLTKIIVSS